MFSNEHSYRMNNAHTGQVSLTLYPVAFTSVLSLLSSEITGNTMCNNIAVKLANIRLLTSI